MRTLVAAVVASILFASATDAGAYQPASFKTMEAEPPVVIPGKKPYTANDFEVYVLSQDFVNYLISYVGQERVARIGPNGVSRSNRAYEAGDKNLYVETQKVGFQAIRGGIAANNVEWVDKGLTALEWGLQPSVLGDDYSFPDQRDTDRVVARALHPKSIFLHSASRAILLIRQADLPQDLKDRAEALVPRLRLAVREIVDSGDAQKFFKVVDQSSQLAFVAGAIHQVGLLSDDAVLVQVARDEVQSIIDRQFENGAFVEKGGTDTAYQMNTLELMIAYNAALPPGEWRDTVALSNQKGIEWFMSRVSTSGKIDTTGNTRTEPCGKTKGYFPKGLDIDYIPIQLLYYAYLSGTIKKIEPVARKIQFLGVTDDHIGHCDNKVVE